MVQKAAQKRKRHGQTSFIEHLGLIGQKLPVFAIDLLIFFYLLDIDFHSQPRAAGHAPAHNEQREEARARYQQLTDQLAQDQPGSTQLL